MHMCVIVYISFLKNEYHGICILLLVSVCYCYAIYTLMFHSWSYTSSSSRSGDTYCKWCRMHKKSERRNREDLYFTGQQFLRRWWARKWCMSGIYLLFNNIEEREYIRYIHIYLIISNVFNNIKIQLFWRKNFCKNSLRWRTNYIYQYSGRRWWSFGMSRWWLLWACWTRVLGIRLRSSKCTRCVCKSLLVYRLDKSNNIGE